MSEIISAVLSEVPYTHYNVCYSQGEYIYVSKDKETPLSIFLEDLTIMGVDDVKITFFYKTDETKDFHIKGNELKHYFPTACKINQKLQGYGSRSVILDIRCSRAYTPTCEGGCCSRHACGVLKGRNMCDLCFEDQTLCEKNFTPIKIYKCVNPECTNLAGKLRDVSRYLKEPRSSRKASRCLVFVCTQCWNKFDEDWLGDSPKYYHPSCLLYTRDEYKKFKRTPVTMEKFSPGFTNNNLKMHKKNNKSITERNFW